MDGWLFLFYFVGVCIKQLTTVEKIYMKRTSTRRMLNQLCCSTTPAVSATTTNKLPKFPNWGTTNERLNERNTIREVEKENKFIETNT